VKREFRFYKTVNDEWFVDLPEWKGDPDDLQMIQGADEWLMLIADGTKGVLITISDKAFEDAYFMKLLRLGEPNLGGGGNYFLETYQHKKLNLKIWLCEIVKFIFGEYPQRLYFAKANP